MKENQTPALRPALAALGLLALASTAGAQTFTYAGGDLCLTFRDTASDSYEIVADIGPASTYLNMAPGSTNHITAYSNSQLGYPSFGSGSTFPDLDNLSWAVVGGIQSTVGYSGYPVYTLWLTVPRNALNPQTPASPAMRHSAAEQAQPYLEIHSILQGASSISAQIGSANTYNTTTLVRENMSSSLPYYTQAESVYMKSLATPSLGTLNDTWTDNNLEAQTAPIAQANGVFTDSGSVERSDLYEIRPLDDGHGHTVVDPHTGLSGQAYYVGYFELASDGTMTFVRSTGTVRVPPPAPVLSINKAGNVNTISFVSSNSATYTLCFTNSAGLSAPVSTWPTGASLTGNGSLQSLQDTTTDPVRFYRVKGQ